MSVLNTIRVQILRDIRPTKSEIHEAFAVFDKVKTAIQIEVEERKIDTTFVELEGSSGRKQTHLRNWKELDVFIGLPLSIIPQKKEDEQVDKSLIRRLMRQLVEGVAVSAVNRVEANNIQVAFSEHPYLIAQIDGHRVDIVFCFDLPKDYILKNGPITAVDRTPHHSNFIDDNLSDIQRDDVRLLKSFLHSSFVYGDSSPIGRSGFTGFSSEMLIFHTQTFEAALEYLSNHKPEPLDFFNREPNSLKQRFSHNYFIISDPIDPNRNIASSISKRAYRFASYNSHKLLQNPSKAFFERKPVPQLKHSELALLEPNYWVIEFQDKTGWHYTKTRDKLYRYFTTLSKYLKQEPTGEPRFGVVTFEELFQDKVFAVALHIENVELSPSFIRLGPSQTHVEGVKQFIEKHPDAFMKKGRYHIEILRTFTNAEQAIRSYLTNHPISSRLEVMGVTQEGTTQIGRQALWILINAIQPFLNSNPSEHFRD